MSYEKFKNRFLEKTKEFVEQYDIDEANKKAIKSILTYFAGIDTKNYPITKGLLIHGHIGSGKTITLKIIQQLVKQLAITNVRDIVSEFNISGFDALDTYAKTKNRVFDDIGQENNGKYYGNDTNVIQELIIRRYEVFQNKGIITHFTTNLGTKEQIIGRYGERAFDRMKEMCTSIILGDNNISRRNKYNPINKNIIKDEPVDEPVIDVEKENLQTALRTIERIYNGEVVSNALYVIAYDYLRINKIINLSDIRKKEITIKATKYLEFERNQKIDKLINKGRLADAKNLAKKIIDIKLDIVVMQKKLGVIQFLSEVKEMGITVNEILNK